MLDRLWGGWDFEAFAARRDGRAVPAGASAAPGPDWYTRIFYLHRKDVTERPEAQQAHRQFWERYFDEGRLADPQLAGSRLHFEAQAPVLDYAAESLMAVPTQAELVAQERERVRYERAALERMRDELESSRAALDAGRERLAAQRQQWQARESELARGRARLQERETELVSERERLQAWRWPRRPATRNPRSTRVAREGYVDGLARAAVQRMQVPRPTGAPGRLRAEFACP